MTMRIQSITIAARALALFEDVNFIAATKDNRNGVRRVDNGRVTNTCF